MSTTRRSRKETRKIAERKRDAWSCNSPYKQDAREISNVSRLTQTRSRTRAPERTTDAVRAARNSSFHTFDLEAQRHRNRLRPCICTLPVSPFAKQVTPSVIDQCGLWTGLHMTPFDETLVVWGNHLCKSMDYQTIVK